MVTRGGIKPKIKKVQAILTLNPPNNVKKLDTSLDWYLDMWVKRSEMLAPLSRRESVEKQRPSVGIQFIKQHLIMSKRLSQRGGTGLSRLHEALWCITASTKGLGALITQDNMPIAYVSQNFQLNNTIPKLELLVKEIHWNVAWTTNICLYWSLSHKQWSRFNNQQSNPFKDTLKGICP